MNYNFKADCSPQKVSFDIPGRYKIEVWGAKGGGQNYGRGAYSSGILDVRKPFVAFLYVGGSGGTPTAGCNGGGRGGRGYGQYESGGGGGGSTDLRLLNGDTPKALASRLIVAGGGGGGGGNGSGSASDAGAETSNPSTISGSCGDVSPGVVNKGTLLKGDDGLDGRDAACQSEGKGAGGGGFIGGHSSQSYSKSAGSGGTSYVAPSLSDPIILTGDKVPEKGNNGKARVTFLGQLCQTRKNKQQLSLEALWMLSLCEF